MRTLLALMLIVVAVPAHAERVCRQVGQAIQCSDGSAAHQGSNGTFYQAVPPKTGAAKPRNGIDSPAPGKTCRVLGTTRVCD
jgi:hypothetical protein